MRNVIDSVRNLMPPFIVQGGHIVLLVLICKTSDITHFDLLTFFPARLNPIGCVLVLKVEMTPFCISFAEIWTKFVQFPCHLLKKEASYDHIFVNAMIIICHFVRGNGH